MKEDRKHILFVCSWLNHKNNVGSFFIEQAKIFESDYEITMLNFKPFGLIDFLKNIFFFNTEFYDKDLNKPYIIYVTHFDTKIFGRYFSDYLKKKVVSKVYHLIKSRRKKVDLIHTQSLFNSFEYVMIFNKLFKLKYLLTEHNQLSFFNKPKDIKQKVINFLDNSSYNLVVSNDKIRQFYTNGLFYDFWNVGNMVNEKLFYYKFNEKSDNIFRIITIGAYSKVKDQTTILKALKIFEKKIGSRKTTFTWIGYNSWGIDKNKEVNKLIESFGFSKIEFILIPVLSRIEIQRYLQESNVFLFSSIVEGMPVSVLEALACGVPVISTNCGGVDELIDSENGKIIPLFDFEKMEVFLEKIFQGEIKFEKNNISKKIHNFYGTQEFKIRVESFYKKALNK
ncbi:Glycosyltransferase involved in cell wall bisynthesis [Aquiflexum balticum DSM 16537]|uniref:Glycosyltransferase involved in cell wall bisynthesis n=1 Tax=Aquiflexum balticum DSM 16537 TaxID=758820 RepID=A0A1W2HB15_9BACT|nr:glycosyltransferase family 4 protein [Aquiflexum balticum]SMD46063.1 Glycosyltransferase involved in cell wall bisynthesis [Aquiflexum balticum DSM 16537]